MISPTELAPWFLQPDTQQLRPRLQQSVYLDAAGFRELQRVARLRYEHRVLVVAIHNENEFDDEEDRRQRKQQHHVDGVGSEEVVRATDDAGQREDDDGVRREHVAQQALEDEVVEHPPGDDLHREDRKRHGTAHLGPSSGPVLKNIACTVSAQLRLSVR